MSIALRMLERRRAAQEREARQSARLAAQEPEADDDDDELERKQRVLEAWEKGEILSVDTSKCDITKPVPVKNQRVRWPIVCKVADTTDPALVALLRQDDIKKILRAGRNAVRTLRVPVASVTHADRTESHGKSVVGYVIGCKGDGTPGKCVAIQKTLNLLCDLDGNYAGSIRFRSGIMGTLGMERCFVFPMAIVEPEDRCIGEGSLYGAQVHATGFRLVGQCLMVGAPDAWAPDVRDYVLADKDHRLFEYARLGIAPPLMAPQSSQEMSGLVKEGLANMSDDARERQKKGQTKGCAASGTSLRGDKNLTNQKTIGQLARYGGFPSFVLLFEALECTQLNRKPAPWAKGYLKPKLLKRVAKAGLADTDFGPCFVTVLKEEKKLGRQLFCIEGFRFAKEEGTMGPAHVSDFKIETQRGPFPPYDVAVALDLVREGERAPKLPWPPALAPDEVKALIARAEAWSPPASEPSPAPVSEPSPPPAKKLRAAPPRRSTRLAK